MHISRSWWLLGTHWEVVILLPSLVLDGVLRVEVPLCSPIAIPSPAYPGSKCFSDSFSARYCPLCVL